MLFRSVADLFVQHSVHAAIELIRADEVSFIHTVADAKKYIAAVNRPGVSSINGDLYHMQSGESHLGTAILEAGEMLVNLHIRNCWIHPVVVRWAIPFVLLIAYIFYLICASFK